jgi:hypothetical protein
MVSNEEVRILTWLHKRARGKNAGEVRVRDPDSLDAAPSIKQSYYQGAPIPFPIIMGREYGKTVR